MNYLANPWVQVFLFVACMSAGWVPMPLPVLLFVGFVPLLWLEAQVSSSSRQKPALALWRYAWVAFVGWNASTTWWITLASPAGGVFAILANALLMTIPVLLFQWTKRVLGNAAGYMSFPAYWIAFEHIHLRWELAWPWLTLGNGLSMFPSLMQWYEYTGALGGSVWILAANLVAFFTLNSWLRHRPRRELSVTGHSARPAPLWGAGFLAILFLPGIVSVWMDGRPLPEGRAVEVVVVQPNVDPYSEKFDPASRTAQLRRLVSFSDSLLTPRTAYLVWPETSVPFTFWTDRLSGHKVTSELRRFLQRQPDAAIVTGLFSYLRYRPEDEMSATARKFPKSGECCFDAFNSAVLIDTSQTVQLYHKSKLVPGVERMPYPGMLKFLGLFAISLGGISGSLGLQPEREVFTSPGGTVAPVVCYESVFGDYVTSYIRLGAQAIFIITNDGWWGNTPGHQQHLHYASMRAIETRRSIARSANTGISCFIDRRGRIRQRVAYAAPGVIRDEIMLDDTLTFYSRHGDYLGWLGLVLAAFFLISGGVRRVVARS